MAVWYVYQHDGDPLGPWDTETVADSILAGRLAPDVWVAAPGGPRWLRALDVPFIAQLVEGIPTRPRRDSGMRLMPGMIINEGDLDSAPSTTKTAAPSSAEQTLKILVPLPTRTIESREDAIAFAADDLAPSTDPVPPTSSTPSPPYARISA